MADKRDFYEILGVGKGASDAEIKSAYRALVKKHHPDLNPGDKAAEEKTKEINEAYEILSDKDKKARYDQYGHAGVDPNFGAGGAGAGDFGGFDFGGFTDIFDMFTGGSSRRTSRQAAAPKPVYASCVLTLEECLEESEHEFDVSLIDRCATCGGTGAKPGTSPEKCTHCGGSGTVIEQRRTIMGVMQVRSDCPHCGGKGTIIREKCGTCVGAGLVRKRKKIKVNIPAGAYDGLTLQVTGAGNTTQSGQRGDVYVEVAVKKHPQFRRDGKNLYMNVNISMTEAALGGTKKIPTIEGKPIEMTVKEGTQTGEVSRISGKGIPDIRRAARGDMYVTFTVLTPTKLTSEQKELLRQLSETFGDDGSRAPGKKNGKKKK
ncbi:MAG: molecular chaperone DnaJ [Oscillospiraceae bacterium]|jgi:molecular chaperone DnaJ|nr:molecular chaperone DnaJ [Oscillospiraceae bacterium]